MDDKAVEGIIIGDMTEEIIESILPESEIENIAQGILALNEWAVPHWDWVVTIKIGGIKVSKKTVGFIIDRLTKILPGKKKDIMLLWLNYGWSTKENFPDWKCCVDFSQIIYKEDPMYLWRNKK